MNTAAYNPEDLNKLFELDTKSSEAVAALAAETVAGPAEELNKLFNLASVEEPLKTGSTLASSRDKPVTKAQKMALEKIENLTSLSLTDKAFCIKNAIIGLDTSELDDNDLRKIEQVLAQYKIGRTEPNGVKCLAIFLNQGKETPSVAASKDISKEILEFFQGSFKDSMGVTLSAKNYAFSIEELAKHMKEKDTFSVAQSLSNLVQQGKIKKVNKRYEYLATSVAASKVEESTELKKGKTYTVYMHDPRNNEYAYLQGYYEAKDGESLDDFKKRICGRSADTCFVFDSPVDKRASKTAADVNIKDPTLTVQEAAKALELSIFRPETLRGEPTEPEDPSTVIYVLDYYGLQGEQIHREFPTPEERQTYMTEHQPEISRPSLTTVRSNAAAAMSPTDELNQIFF